MDNYKISVIIPVYKVEKYLNRCMESVTRQTYHNLEIILIDDGSPDNCPKICDSWALRDNRIKVIHKQNGGLSSARNAGLDAANGDFIAFVDSDDYIELNMYEIMLKSILETNSNLACCGRMRVSDKKLSKAFVFDGQTIISGREAVRQLLIGGYIDAASWDKLYKREMFFEKRFPLGEINEDIVLTVKILSECNKVVHVGIPLYYYCQNRDSITQSKYSVNRRIILKHLDEIKRYLCENYDDFFMEYRILEARYCQSVLYLLLNDITTYKNYQSDYNKFYLRFKKCFKDRVKCGQISKTDLIKGYLIYYKVYLWIHLIKKIMHI